MGTGATLEFQSRWPVAEDEHEDPRFERLLLLLQVRFVRVHEYMRVCHETSNQLNPSWNVRNIRSSMRCVDRGIDTRIW